MDPAARRTILTPPLILILAAALSLIAHFAAGFQPALGGITLLFLAASMASAIALRRKEEAAVWVSVERMRKTLEASRELLLAPSGGWEGGGAEAAVDDEAASGAQTGDPDGRTPAAAAQAASAAPVARTASLALARTAAAFEEVVAEAQRGAMHRAEDLSAALEGLRAHEERLERDARAAERIQRGLMARGGRDLPRREEARFGLSARPGTDPGGAFCDFFRVGKNGLIMASAEPSGLGMAAALSAAVARETLRAKAGWGLAASAILHAVDTELEPLLAGTGLSMRWTIAVIDLETGFLSIASDGGGELIHWRRRRGAIQVLAGLPGKAPVAEFGLEEGDRLLVCTPGAVRTRGPGNESFGLERLSAAMAALGRERVEAMPERLIAELTAFVTGSLIAGGTTEAPALSLTTEDLAFASFELVGYAAALDRRTSRKPSFHEDWAASSREAAAQAAAGRHEEALAIYERLLTFDPEDVQTLNNLGALLWRTGRRDRAFTLFRKAARLAPEDGRVARNLQMAERALGREATRQGGSP